MNHPAQVLPIADPEKQFEALIEPLQEAHKSTVRQLASKLTPEQLTVVCHRAGHAKIMAGAGSGKTSTMVLFITVLVACGVDHRKILCLMFNADARDQFQDRLVKGLELMGIADMMPQVMTFHGLGGLWLKKLVKAELLPPHELVTNTHKQEMQFRDFLNEAIQVKKLHGTAKKPSPFMIQQDFMSFCGLVKADLSSQPSAVFEKYGFVERFKYFIPMYQAWERYRRLERQFRHFDDMIFDPLTCSIENRDARKLLAGGYEYIIVDEYQDVNESQQAMIRLASDKKANVIVVGDVDQCIYEWRGANPNYMLKLFDEDFRNPTTYYMSKTFRYGHRLALAAAHVISNNKNRHDLVVTASPYAPQTHIELRYSDNANPNVVRVIQEYMRGPSYVEGEEPSLDHMCILLRKFSQAIPLEIELLRAKIDYKLSAKGKSFFDQRAILTLIWALRLMTGRAFEETSRQDTYLMLRAFLGYFCAITRGDSLNALVNSIIDSPSNAVRLLDEWKLNAPYHWAKKSASTVIKWWTFCEDFKAERETPSEALRLFMEHAEIMHHVANLPRHESGDVEDMVIAFAEYTLAIESKENLSVIELVDMLQELRDLKTASENDLGELEQHDMPHVLITSVHKSKGLEWPLVLLPSLYEGNFPHIPRTKEEKKNFDIDSERRLFYVAATRAENKLVCFSPNDQQLAQWVNSGFTGHPEVHEQNIKDPGLASRFLYEMNIRVCQNLNKVISGEIDPDDEERVVIDKYLDRASS